MAETTVERMPEAQAPATREESRYLVPPVDIIETEDSLIVIADLPGVDKDNINIRVENNTLTIQGSTQHVAPGNEVRAEYRLRNFYRQFTLGEQVNQEGISAELKHGVLTLTLPKTEKAKPRQIQISMA